MKSLLALLLLCLHKFKMHYIYTFKARDMLFPLAIFLSIGEKEDFSHLRSMFQSFF